MEFTNDYERLAYYKSKMDYYKSKMDSDMDGGAKYTDLEMEGGAAFTDADLNSEKLLILQTMIASLDELLKLFNEKDRQITIDKVCTALKEPKKKRSWFSSKPKATQASASTPVPAPVLAPARASASTPVPAPVPARASTSMFSFYPREKAANVRELIKQLPPSAATPPGASPGARIIDKYV